MIELVRQRAEMWGKGRKPLRPNPVAPWALRVGHLRIFDDVVDDPRATVRILAAGRKRGSTLCIAGKEIVL